VRADGGDAEAAAAATFGQVAQILQDHCIACHGGKPDGGPGVPGLIDFRNQTDDGGLTLYQRLTTPLPTNQEGRCYFNPPPEGGTGGEAGAEGGAETGAEAGGGEAGLVDVIPADVIAAAEAEAGPTRPNRTPIIGSSLANSYLYGKITGNFEGKGINPSQTMPEQGGCGQRMPRIPQINPADGGPAGSVGCDNAVLDGGAAANCLSDMLVSTVASWINAGAPNN